MALRLLTWTYWCSGVVVGFVAISVGCAFTWAFGICYKMGGFANLPGTLAYRRLQIHIRRFRVSGVCDHAGQQHSRPSIDQW
jgi:hypothetical protein